MKHLTFFLLLFLPTLLAAQACDYDKLFREGKTFAKQRQYKKALYKYNSARRCDPRKGETVDAAIEDLLDQVEREKKTADFEREKAQKALEEADIQRKIAEEEKLRANQQTHQAEVERDRVRKALLEVEKQSAFVVANILKNAENDVYHLRYAEALEKMNAAAAIGQEKHEVARALIEIAFFYAESGRFSEAKEITALAAKLFDKDKILTLIDTFNVSTTRQAFRTALYSLDAEYFIELDLRYYPVTVEVKGGNFILGCDTDNSLYCNKLPYVWLSDFRIARTETTIWQFALYAAATGRQIQDFSPPWGLDGDNPVVNVNWYQAIEYANWLSERLDFRPTYIIDSIQKDVNNKNLNKTDTYKWTVSIIPGANGYRLPTGAEWEYAARGGFHRDTFIFSGSNDLTTVAWCRKNANTFGVHRTHPVSTRLPNSLGLFDMSGNAIEWCWDWFEAYHPGIYENPTGPASGSDRVYRGGDFFANDILARVSTMGRLVPSYFMFDHGFRLARN